MLEKELISIVVPIYNVENYLRMCLDSIQNQTYQNFELLDREIQAYKWRLSIHEEETLKHGDVESYQQILVKKAIAAKYFKG